MSDCETEVGIGLWARALRLNAGAIDWGRTRSLSNNSFLETKTATQ